MSDFLLAEGFGNLSDGTHTAGSEREILGNQWTGYANAFVIADRSDGRKWLSVSSSNEIALQSKAFPDPTTVAVCFRVYRHSNEGCTGIIKLKNPSGNAFGFVGINTSGNVIYNRSSTGSWWADTVATSTEAVPLDTETFVEVRVTIGDGTDGAVSFYLNGVLSNTVSSIDTADGTAAGLRSIEFGESSTASETLRAGWTFGDIIVHVGSSPIGDVGVYFVPADADGADTDFTPSAGDNFECVDEIGPDEDTTYNESDGTAGHRDSFETAGVTGFTVLSVGVLARAKKTDTGAATLLLGAIHGASEDQSSAFTLSEDYLTFLELFDDCPSGGSWDSTKVTAAEVSYEVGA